MTSKLSLVVAFVSICSGAEQTVRIETLITIPQTGANPCPEDDEDEHGWAPRIIAKTLKRVARDLPMLKLDPKPAHAVVVERAGKYYLQGLKKGALNIVVCQSLAQFGTLDSAASAVIEGIPLIFLSRWSEEDAIGHELLHVLFQDCNDPVPSDPVLKTLEHVFKDVRVDAKRLFLRVGIGSSAFLQAARRYFAASDSVSAAPAARGSLK